MKVAVIVDDLDSSRRRRCFWEEQLNNFADVEYELVSLLQKMSERQFFDIYDYDVVIFNWCVLDGAIMYESDRVQAIVDFYDAHFTQFVVKGGTIIVEDQPKRWQPEQRAYDVLLHGQVLVEQREQPEFSNQVLVNEQMKKHPLVQHLPLTLQSVYNHPPQMSWFPEGSTSVRSIQSLNPDKIYSGSFRRWDSEWLPLLYDKDGRNPIMLVKTQGLGLWIVTTMFLASSNIRELVESIILGPKKHELAIRSFHERQRGVRVKGAVRVALAMALMALAFFGLLKADVFGSELPYGSTVIGTVGWTLVLTGVFSTLTILRKRVWSWLRVALNR